MPLSALNKPKDIATIVKATPNIFYYFKAKDYAAIPGVSEADLTALGHLTPGSGGAGTVTVAAASAPRPARFRKKLTAAGATQKYVTTFGNGVDAAGVAAASAAGWEMTTPPRTVSFGDTALSKNIAIKLNNGIYVVRSVPTSLATAENATLFGWELSLSDALINKAVRGTRSAKPATVRKATGLGGYQTVPCKKTKLADAAAAGWKKASDEVTKDPNVIPD